MEIPSITDKMQLHKGAITPTLDNGSPPSPPVEIESDLSGPGVTRPTERGDEVKINQDNRFPAVQQRIEEFSQLEEGDIEMKIADLPIKENLMETEAAEKPPFQRYTTPQKTL